MKPTTPQRQMQFLLAGVVLSFLCGWNADGMTLKRETHL